MLDGDILVAQLLRFLFRVQHGFVQIRTDLQPHVRTLYLGQRPQQLLRLLHEIVRVNPHLLDQPQNQAVFDGQQTVKQMLLRQLLIAVIIGKLFHSVDGFNRFLCKFVNVHSVSSASLY